MHDPLLCFGISYFEFKEYFCVTLALVVLPDWRFLYLPRWRSRKGTPCTGTHARVLLSRRVVAKQSKKWRNVHQSFGKHRKFPSVNGMIHVFLSSSPSVHRHLHRLIYWLLFVSLLSMSKVCLPCFSFPLISSPFSFILSLVPPYRNYLRFLQHFVLHSAVFLLCTQKPFF